VALFAAARAGDARAREALVQRYLPLAERIARRYRGAHGSLEDLVQVASLALVKAVDGFDTSRGVAFSSYAVPTIAGELMRHLRDTTWRVHIPRRTRELASKLDKRTEALQSRLGRSPTVAELADALDAREEEVLEALHAAQAQRAVSLDAPLDTDGEVGVAERLGTVDDRLAQVEDRLSLDDAADRVLSDRDRAVLAMRFSGEMSQSEIAERIGVSQMQVSRILRAALSRLRESGLDA